MIDKYELYLGNCVDFMKKIPNNYIDLTVTSPPYDNMRSYEGNFSFDFECIANELYCITKIGGVIVWIVGDKTINGSETGTSFKQVLYFKEIGFNLHDTMIYEKISCPFPETNRYYPCFEYMFILSKGKLNVFNAIQDKRNKQFGRGRKSTTERQYDGSLKKRSAIVIKEFGVRTNVWKYSPGFRTSTLDKEAFIHPATFPEELARDHIYSWSNEDMIVFDPFMGSGTTGKVALLMGRRFLGCEIVDKYFKIAKVRIENAFKGQSAVSSDYLSKNQLEAEMDRWR